MTAKLADFKSHDSYVAHYGDAAGIFGRYDLVEAPTRPVSNILQSRARLRLLCKGTTAACALKKRQKTKKNKNFKQIAGTVLLAICFFVK